MTDYATLQADVAAYSARGDISAVAPSFIRIAEAWINRRVRILEQETDVELEFDSGNEYMADLPTGFLGFRSIVNPDSSDPDCEYMPPAVFDVVSRQPRDGLSPATPSSAAYTIASGKVKLLSPVGATDPVTLAAVYHKRFLPLSDSNTTNYLLTNHYDLYLKASLREMWDFVDEQAMVDRYERQAEKIVGEIDEEEKGKRRGAPPLRRRPPAVGVV